MMKILRLDVEGFRSLRQVTWTPGDLNVVIGPNGSGKSNLLRVLEMLGVAARGSLGKYVQQEGGMEPLLWDGKEPRIRLGIKLAPLDSEFGQANLTYDLTLARLGPSSAYRIEYELLGNFDGVEQGTHTKPIKILERDPQRAVIFDHDQKALVASEASMPEQETLLSVAGAPFAANLSILDCHRALTSWSVYQRFHTHREAPIRAPVITRTETRVQDDGQNLISVLHTLYTGSREFKREVNTAMRAAFSDDFEELVFPPAADQRIQLRVRWKSLQREQSAADLSDGTLRFLFLLAVLANPLPPPVIAIDEPETGLHPSMLPIIAEYARDAATRAQVILTTHSPELLDAFSDHAPVTSVMEWRDGATQLRVLSGASLDYWLQQYTLGELYRSNELEGME